MKKVFVIVFLVLLVIVFGFFLIKSKIGVSEKKEIAKSSLPIFNQLSRWVPNATWDEPQKSTEMSPYGKTTGLRMSGKITGKNASISRNFEDKQVMQALGYFEDMQFAADGPGTSNWGYSKTENGKTQIVVFRYSTNAILGPESKEPPFVNLSVFVSDPFVRE